MKKNMYNFSKEKLDALQSEFYEILNNSNFFNIYNANFKFPNNSDYSRNYSSTINSLNRILNEMNIIYYNTQKNIDYLNEISKVINIELDINREENKILENRVKNIESSDNTSSELLGDYTDLYKNQRSYNIGMLITFVVAFLIMRRIFSVEQSVPNSTSNSSLPETVNTKTNTK